MQLCLVLVALANPSRLFDDISSFVSFRGIYFVYLLSRGIAFFQQYHVFDFLTESVFFTQPCMAEALLLAVWQVCVSVALSISVSELAEPLRQQRRANKRTAIRSACSPSVVDIASPGERRANEDATPHSPEEPRRARSPQQVGVGYTRTRPASIAKWTPGGKVRRASEQTLNAVNEASWAPHKGPRQCDWAQELP